MHRLAVENNLRREYEVAGLDTTPLRGTTIELPRRLLVRDFETVSGANFLFQDHSSLSEVLTKNSNAPGASVLQSGHVVRDVPSTSGGSQHVQQPRYSLPLWSRVANNVGDRFIPRRHGVNLDLSHYYHTHGDENEKDGLYLDVFGEIKNATDHWRRKNMGTAFQRFNIISGIQSKRVLNIGLSAELDYKQLKVGEFHDECQWDCRPRKQPLMNMKGENSKRYRDHGAQIFRFAMSIRFKNLIDWSSKNILAAALADSMCLCDVDFKHMAKVYRIDNNSYLCCLKWNSAGTQVLMCGLDGNVSLYDVNLAKVVWTQKCPCFEEKKKCKVTCTLWAKKDQHIITSCDEGFLIIRNFANGNIITPKNFKMEIITFSLSPKEQYLVISGTDRLVRLLDYPTLVPLFEIVFYTSVKAFAWHPWSSGILCIGGGPGDASLSLWNVNSQRQLGYRKVKFIGSIDSMMFNRLSGELLVHWYYLENDRLRSKIAVLAGLDRIVDAVPIQPEHRMLNIVWSPDHTRLAMQHRDTLVIWNFFGNELNKWDKSKKTFANKNTQNRLRNYCFDTHTITGPYTALACARRGKDFTYYNVR